MSDTRAVQTIVPRYANTTVRTIGSRASHTAIEKRFLSGLLPGLLLDFWPGLELAAGSLSACIAGT
jgi:hypothetical protein